MEDLESGADCLDNAGGVVAVGGRVSFLEGSSETCSKSVLLVHEPNVLRNSLQPASQGAQRCEREQGAAQRLGPTCLYSKDAADTSTATKRGGVPR